MQLLLTFVGPFWGFCQFVWNAFILILPAAMANMAPVLARKLDRDNRYGRPISARWLGVNKTWRGLITGYVAALITVGILHDLQQIGTLTDTLVDYLAHPVTYMAFLFSMGALGGDMVKSFFKRNWAHIEPGHPWPWWDRVDFILGSLFLSIPLFWSYFGDLPKLTLLGETAVFIILVGPLVQRVVNVLAVRNGIKETL